MIDVVKILTTVDLEEEALRLEGRIGFGKGREVPISREGGRWSPCLARIMMKRERVLQSLEL